MNRLRTTGLAAVAVTTTAAVFVGGLAVGRGLDRSASTPSPVVHAAGPLGLVAGSRDLSVADDCDDLLQWYVARGLRKVGPWGWDSPMYYALDDVAGTEVMGSDAAPEAAQGRATEQSSSATGTNVQEVGVDEPDLVKTDGRILVRADNDVVTVYDVTGEAPVLVSRLQLSDIGDAELLLVGDRVVVIGTDTATLDSAGATPSEDGRDRFWPGPWSFDTRVMVLDLATPGSPQIVADTVYDSSLVSARQHGDVVRLLLSADLPQLDFVTPDDDTTERQAAQANRDLVRATTLSDWLPTLTTSLGGSDVRASRRLRRCGAAEPRRRIGHDQRDRLRTSGS